MMNYLFIFAAGSPPWTGGQSIALHDDYSADEYDGQERHSWNPNHH